MAEPFLGEIRMFAFGQVPSGWAQCNGQLLAVNQNQALFTLIGKVYGGDGITNFALPNLQGRVPLQISSSIPLGTAAGEATHSLTPSEMPQHLHTINATSQDASTGTAAGNAWASSPNINRYAATSNVVMAGAALAISGASAAHDNMQPFVVGNYCIAVQGIFPPRPQ